MANHKSAEKRARQSLKRAARNTQTRKNVKTVEKKLVADLAAKGKDAETSLREFTSKVMKAVTKGVIKKQTAARKISRLAARTAKTATK